MKTLPIFVERSEYNLKIIQDIKDKNPIWEVVIDDARELVDRKSKEGYLCLGSEVLLNNKRSNQYIVDCMRVAKSLNISYTEVFEEWDIVRVYEYLTVIMYADYQEIPPEKG